jgi:opacity protein-like surface antigen
MRCAKVWKRGLVAAAALAGLAGSALGQAWLAPKGEASLSVGYGDTFMKYHYFGSNTFDDGHMRSQTVGFGLDYAVSDRVTVSLGIPYVAGKYMGMDPHIALDGTTIDDGRYHGTFTDLQPVVRWRATNGALVLTPYVGALIPTHDYRFFAHTAPGRDLHEYAVGFFLARRLDPVLDDGYVQFRYGYVFVEKVLDIPHDKSTADLTLGYFVTPALGARLLLTYLYTHGGITIPDGVVCDPVLLCGPTDPSPTWQHHDQISHDVALNGGVGLSYSLTGSVDLTATYFASLYGENGHKINNGLSFGVTWSFSPVQLYRRLLAKSQNP